MTSSTTPVIYVPPSESSIVYVPPSESPIPDYQTITLIACQPPDGTMGYSSSSPVVCTATNRLNCNELKWLNIYWDPVPVPVGEFRYTPFNVEDLVAGIAECSADRFSIVFTPVGGNWNLMSRYQINISRFDGVDEAGGIFGNDVSQQFYTTPAGAIGAIVPADAAGAVGGMDDKTWRWLGPVLGIIGLLLLLLLIFCCCKFCCGKKKKSALAETSRNITSVSSASTRALDDSNGSLQASQSFVVGQTDSLHGDSSAYLRSSYSEKPRRPTPDFALFNQKKPQSQLESDANEGSVPAIATLRAWENAQKGGTGRGEGVEWEDVYDASNMHQDEGVVVDIEKRQKYSHSESQFEPSNTGTSASSKTTGRSYGTTSSKNSSST